MRLRVLQFDPGHLDFFEKAETPDLLLKPMSDLEKDILWYYQQPNTEMRSIIINNHVLAICGLDVIRPKAAGVICIFGREFKESKITIHKQILKFIEEKEKDFHRFEMEVLVDYSAGIKWAESLGFENEGLMRQYDEHKRDYYRFARVK